MSTPSSIADNVLEFIREQDLLSPGDAVLVALSGGPDSVTLLSVLCELSRSGALPLDISTAHLNHDLRGEESRADADFCGQVATDLNVDHVSDRIDVESKRRDGESLEAAARRVRYSFLARTAQQKGIQHVAVGHHADDQAETLLLHLTRGCGLNGLVGMPPSRKSLYSETIRVIRPILPLRRKPIRQYLSEEHLSYRLDSTNRATCYRRNHIRHELLPALQGQMPGDLTTQLNRCAELAGAVNRSLKQMIGNKWEHLCTDHDERSLDLNIGELRGLAPELRKHAVRHALRLVRPAGEGVPDLKREHYDQIIELTDSSVGRCLTLPGNIMLRREHGLLRCEYGDLSEGFETKALHLPGRTKLPAIGSIIKGKFLDIEKNQVKEYIARSTPASVYLSTKVLSLPLQVRNRRPGDRFYPLGAPGHRKLKDYFIDKKVPRHRRNNIPLVVDGEGRIVWVVGIEIAHPFRLREQTNHAIHLRHLPLEAPDR
jgi:tRNA(Ile)-lysidine synthase